MEGLRAILARSLERKESSAQRTPSNRHAMPATAGRGEAGGGSRLCGARDRVRQRDRRAVGPLEPPARLGRLVREAGLPRITLHGPRHSCATGALEAGVEVLYVAEPLGTAPAITQSVYQHVRTSASSKPRTASRMPSAIEWAENGRGTFAFPLVDLCRRGDLNPHGLCAH